MIYFKKRLLLLILSIVFIPSAMAFYPTGWRDICSRNGDVPVCKDPKINQFSVDLSSVNKHNDSIYYAVRYFTNTNGGTVSIIQYKNGKIGMVDTFENPAYEDIMQNNIKYKHPAKTEKQAKVFKDLRKDSLIYKANLYALEVIRLQEEGSDAIDRINHGLKNPEDIKISEDTEKELNSSVNDPYWGAYMRDLQRRIKLNWKPPRSNTSSHVLVLFDIAKDGSLISAKILKSSGIPSMDNAAINAIKATKFKPLPKNCKDDSVSIEFTFDYNVIGER